MSRKKGLNSVHDFEKSKPERHTTTDENLSLNGLVLPKIIIQEHLNILVLRPFQL